MKITVKQLSRAAMIAALYTALCFFMKPISFGIIQFRISEALCVLPIFMGEAVWGLFIGCIIANFLGGSSVAILDMILGSLTTLLAAIFTRNIYKKSQNLYLSLIPPVIMNALIVGSYIPFIYTDMNKQTALPVVALSILSVGIGQAVVIYFLGVPLAKSLKRLSF